jgi:hypothetical protein
MVYNVPRSGKSLKHNRFEFTIDGKAYDLPKFKLMTIEQMEALDTTDASGQFTQVLALFGNPDTPIGRALRALDIDQFMHLFQAWQTLLWFLSSCGERLVFEFSEDCP